jgi:hypothetical protein
LTDSSEADFSSLESQLDFKTEVSSFEDLEDKLSNSTLKLSQEDMFKVESTSSTEVKLSESIALTADTDKNKNKKII